MKKLKYTWKQFDKVVNTFYQKIINSDTKYKSIAGIAFGGLPLAISLKNKLDLPLRVIFASSYKNKKQVDLKIKLGDLDKLISPALIIDDIVDSGRTLSTVTSYLTQKGIKHHTAAIFAKPAASIKPNWHINEVQDNIWVVMPWE